MQAANILKCSTIHKRGKTLLSLFIQHNKSKYPFSCQVSKIRYLTVNSAFPFGAALLKHSQPDSTVLYSKPTCYSHLILTY